MKKLPSAIVRKIRDAWRNGFTPGGRYLLLAVLFAGGFVSVTISLPIDHMFSMLICFFIIARVTGWILKPRVRLRGRVPEKVSAGQSITSEFALENTSRLPALDVSLQFRSLPQYVEHRDSGRILPRIGPNESDTFDLELIARKRGIYRLPEVRPCTSFPFGVCRSYGQGHKPGNLLVLPSFLPITSVNIPVGRRYQPGGIALTSNVGESPEYIGSRDYRAGDPYRHLDFRSWARLAKPAVKEFQEEYYCRLALVVDTYVAPGRAKGPGGFPELEAAVSLTAAVADALSRGEYIVDIFAAGPELYVFRAGRHIAHLDNILEILACVDECRTSPFETITPAIAGELANITSVICVLLDWDADRERFVRAAVESGSAAKVLIVRDGPTTEPFAEAESWAGPIKAFSAADVGSGGIEEI